jgi:CRISPR-associated protein Cas2
MAFGGFKTVWTIVMFDLPTDTQEARQQYTSFRAFILKCGYIMMQFSVYMRHHPSSENAAVHANRIKKALPPKGEVRILLITDHQFSKMEVFFGKRRKSPEKAPEQLQFF